MLDHSPKTLTCASCGAPLDYDGHSTFVQCKFCKTTSVMPGARENQAQLTPGLLAEIRTLAEGGNMLEAVRRFREATGVDLKTAKSSVEMLVSGRVMVASQVISGPLTAEQTGQILEQVQELLRADNKVEAIRRYREATDVSMVKSRDVVERVEAALKGLPPPQPLEIPGQLSPYQPVSPVRHRSWFGLILTLGIFLFVAGLLSLIFFLPGGPFNSMMISNGPAILAESGLGETSLAGVFYHVNDESYRVAMLDPTSGKIRWKADPLPGQGYASAMILVDELVIVASESDLLGFRVEDGSPAWHTILPDRLNYSDQAILAVSGRVITNTADQSIQAYEAATGRLVWDRRLSGYDRSLRLVGGSLLVIDYLGEDYTYNFIFLDPLDGQEQRVITPTCSTDEYSVSSVDPDTGLLFDPEENAIYLVYDSTPGCIQKIDLGSGQPAWQTLDEEWYNFSSGFHGFLTEEHLFFGTGNRLVAVDKQTGSLEVLMEDDENDLLPLAETDGTLVVRLRRTRGTEKFELRGLDAARGSMLWRVDMGDASPIDPPDEMVGLIDEGYPGYTWHLGTSGLILVQFQAEPNQMLIQTIDPTDGNLLNEVTIPLKAVSGDFYSVPEVISWRGDLIYLSVDGSLYCINYMTGEVVFHFQ